MNMSFQPHDRNNNSNNNNNHHPHHHHHHHHHHHYAPLQGPRPPKVGNGGS